MYGLGSGPSTEDLAPPARASTIGATGRNCSRPLMSLSRSTLSACAGMGEQRPVTQGPGAELGATLEPGHHPVVGDDLRGRLGDVGGAVRSGPGRCAAPARSRRRVQPRPSAAPSIGAIRSPSSAATASAAPRAVPESPAAGWTPDVGGTGPPPAAGCWPHSSARCRRPAPGSRLCGAVVQPDSRARAAPPRARPGRWRPDRHDGRRSRSHPGAPVGGPGPAPPSRSGSVRKPPSPVV